MGLNYNAISLVDTLGLVQGIILGSLLVFIGLKKSKSSVYLGLFVIIYSLDLLPSIVEDIELTKYYPKLTLLPFANGWLPFALFFIYIQKISVFSYRKIKYHLLYPGIVVFIIDVIIFCLPPEKRLEIDDSIWYNLLQLFGLFYSIWVAYITVKWINQHIKEVNNQFSAIEFKELKWARLFVITGIIYLTVGIFITLFFEFKLTELVFSSINVILLYWVSLRGILQHSISSLFDTKTDKITEVNIETSKVKEPKQELTLLLEKLDRFVNEHETYTKPELTIIDIADELNVHPRKISTALNSIYQLNFNSYINKYRIEKAITLIKSDLSNNLSIEGIGITVGFQSKSTFYAAFKKVTGTTPSKYKNA